MPEPQATPRPHEVVAGYSRPRPRTTWRYRAMVGLLWILGLGSTAGFAKVTYDDLPRTWAEDPPAVQLSAPEVAAARAVPSYDEAVPVLAYHFVTSRTDNGIDSDYTTTTEEFAAQMAILDEAGFTTVTARQVQAFAEEGATLPDKPILLTFDDGHATNRHVVDPILAEHDFSAVAFLITGRVLDTTDDQGFHLTLQDVHALEESGRWEFGSHTHAMHLRGEGADGEDVTLLDHRVRTGSGDLETPQEYVNRVDADLAASRAWLEEHLQDPLWQFAYPMGGRGSQGEGAMEAELRASLQAHGFDLAYTVGEHDVAHSLVPTTDPQAQPRIDVYRDTPPTELLALIEQSLPVDQGGEQPVGWFDGWYEGADGALRP